MINLTVLPVARSFIRLESPCDRKFGASQSNSSCSRRVFAEGFLERRSAPLVDKERGGGGGGGGEPEEREQAPGGRGARLGSNAVRSPGCCSGLPLIEFCTSEMCLARLQTFRGQRNATGRTSVHVRGWAVSASKWTHACATRWWPKATIASQ